MILYMMEIVIFDLSVTVYEIFALEICVTFIVTNEGAVKYKYSNGKLIYHFLFDGNGNARSNI